MRQSVLTNSFSCRDGIERPAFQFTTLTYKADLTRIDSKEIPVGVIVEARLHDGTLLAALGYEDVSKEDLALVNHDTWGDLFEDGSTLPFLQRLLDDAQSEGKEGASCLEHISELYTFRSALRAETRKDISLIILRNARISAQMNRAAVQPQLEQLLDELVHQH